MVADGGTINAREKEDVRGEDGTIINDNLWSGRRRRRQLTEGKGWEEEDNFSCPDCTHNGRTEE